MLASGLCVYRLFLPLVSSFLSSGCVFYFFRPFKAVHGLFTTVLLGLSWRPSCGCSRVRSVWCARVVSPGCSTISRGRRMHRTLPAVRVLRVPCSHLCPGTRSEHIWDTYFHRMRPKHLCSCHQVRRCSRAIQQLFGGQHTRPLQAMIMNLLYGERRWSGNMLRQRFTHQCLPCRVADAGCWQLRSCRERYALRERPRSSKCPVQHPNWPQNED